MIHDEVFKMYDKCCESYHKVDDFRAKLLGFLPLASGLSILGSLYIEHKPGEQSFLNEHNLEIGLFGLFVSLGLLIFELKGIEKCTQFISLGGWLENKMKSINTDDSNEKKGMFINLSEGDKFINEPVAAAFIYSIVLALWTYVAMLKMEKFCLYLIPIMIFLMSFIFVIVYWQRVVDKYLPSNDKKKSP